MVEKKTEFNFHVSTIGRFWETFWFNEIFFFGGEIHKKQKQGSASSEPRREALNSGSFLRFHDHSKGVPAWWLIPLSKWVSSPQL